ncbi:MAG: preprotein translocase subunit YajC [Sphingomonadales bacterium]|nr:preprotein translocase subunit YajC [Sphingomonadales bacterium]
MSRSPRPSTALATVLAIAGPAAFAPDALAQARIEPQFAAVDSPAPIESAPPTATGGDATARADDAGTGIAPAAEGSTLLRPADPPFDGAGDGARGLADSQRAASQGRRRRDRAVDQMSPDDTQDPRRVFIVPYLEASQVIDAQISPRGETLTYSALAAGIDAGARTGNYRGSLSLRYERRIGWGQAQSYDMVSGVGRGVVAIVPHVLHFEAAGYADRVHVDGQGATSGGIGSPDAVTQVYSVMAGPSLATEAGALEIKGHYRIGYSHVGTPATFAGAGAGAGAPTNADLFDHATVQDARLRVGVQPGEALPVGIAVEGGHYREAISNLDQRTRDSHLRGDVTVPIADHAALVGRVGYEWVDVSSRDALRDVSGNPVISPKGRLVTDPASPRTIAFETEGLIWDAGVLWRPSRRTNLEAHVGRRYGDFGGYGTFSYRPTARSSFNVTVYDNMASFGGAMTNALATLPTDFTAVRDPLAGTIGTCVNSTSGGSCLGGSLASVRSTVFRGRGANAVYNWRWNRYSAGVGVGYDRRRYVAAPGTVLAPLDGKVESYVWTSAYVSANLDPQSVLTGQFDSYWYRSDIDANGNFNALRFAAQYQHRFTRHLAGMAAVGVDSINRKALEDAWRMSGQVGMRYSF